MGGFGSVLDGIKSYASAVARPMASMVLQLFYVMTEKSTRTLDKVLIGIALAYNVIPRDMLPVKVRTNPLFSIVGSLVSLSFVFSRTQSLVTPEINQKVEDTLNGWFGQATPTTPVQPTQAGQTTATQGA